MNSSYTNILDDPNFDIETLIQMINARKLVQAFLGLLFGMEQIIIQLEM